MYGSVQMTRMEKRITLFLILLFAFAVFALGCGIHTEETAEQTAVASEAAVTAALTAEPQPPVAVSPLAAIDYLEPLEDYSWEREFEPEYVMLHFTSAVVVSKEDPYDIRSIRKIFEDGGISIHYIIDRDGTVRCYIPETRAAWHAGKGSFASDARLTNSMNKYSIGIELVAIGSESDMAQYLTSEEYNALDRTLIGFTNEQYDSLKALVEDICTRNGIPFDREHIISHDEYNPQKSDVGELFDWSRIFDDKGDGV